MVTSGLGVEVGETQAAIDLDIVVEHGVSIADLGRSIQRNVKQAVERMTGLGVVDGDGTEVVVGFHIGQDLQAGAARRDSRQAVACRRRPGRAPRLARQVTGTGVQLPG